MQLFREANIIFLLLSLTSYFAFPQMIVLCFCYLKPDSKEKMTMEILDVASVLSSIKMLGMDGEILHHPLNQNIGRGHKSHTP